MSATDLPRAALISHLALNGWEPCYDHGPEMLNRARGLIFTGCFTSTVLATQRLELAGRSCEWGRFSDVDLHALVRAAEWKGWL